MIDSGFRLQTILFLSLNQFLAKNLNNKLKSNKIENAGFPKREADVLELKSKCFLRDQSLIPYIGFDYN